MATDEKGIRTKLGRVVTVHVTSYGDVAIMLSDKADMLLTPDNASRLAVALRNAALEVEEEAGNAK